jgi:hypothetical protein
MTTLNDRYRQLVDTYRLLLGLGPAATDGLTYEIVLLPTFHPPCGICFHDDVRQPLLSLHVLLPTTSEAPAVHRRWEDIAVCPPAQFQRLHGLFARLEANVVDEDEARGRDGILISVRWLDATGGHSAFLTSATLSTQPAHKALMDGLFDTLRALFGHLPAPAPLGATLDAYLLQVQRYWSPRL